MAKGSEDLVLKVSADTSDVATGLAPMTKALDDMGTQADEADAKLKNLASAPTVDTSGIDRANTSMGKLQSTVDQTQSALSDMAKKQITLSVNDRAIAGLNERIATLQTRIAQQVEIGVNTKRSEAQLAILQQKLNQLTDQPHVVDVATPEFGSEIEGISSLRSVSELASKAMTEMDGSVSGVASTVSETIPVLGEMNQLMLTMRLRAEATGAGMGRFATGLSSLTAFMEGPWGIALAAGTGLIATFAASTSEASDATAEWSKQIDFAAGAFDKNNRSIVAQQLQQKGLLEWAQQVGISTQDLVSSLLGQANATDRVNQAMDDLTTANHGKLLDENGALIDNGVAKMRTAFRGLQTDVASTRAANEDVNRAIGDVAKTMDGAAGSAKNVARDTKSYADTVAGLNKQLDDLIQSMHILRGDQVSIREAQIALAKDWAGFSDILAENGRAVKANHKEWDLSTQKGRDAEEQIISTGKSLETLTKAQLDFAVKHGQSTAGIMKNYQNQRDALVAMAEKFGLSKDAAQHYVDTIMATPKEISTSVEVKGAKAAEDQLTELTRDRNVIIHLQASLDPTAKKLLNDPRFGNPSNPNLTSAPLPPSGPVAAPVTFLQPRVFLDSMPIRAALRSDITTAVSSTVAATRQRGRL